ncbi:PREDICTED: zinc finger protein 385C-like [Tinamus guttatus]|uniref:zinc finger protein 385C-like n=1 Tax=Tinamus guttatus TaxID=94827 RepID=UPI00052F3FDB|nr:PREDICTED: zinc finger protein 385C-like [Tinamus guttatus]
MPALLSRALAEMRPAGHSSPLLASLPIPGRPLHTPLDIKHFLTFRLNGTSPLNLFPNFNTNQAEAHYKGHKHARRLKAIEAMKSKQKSAAAHEEQAEGGASRWPGQGAKHKSMLEGHSAQLRRGRGRLLARAGHKAKRIGNKGSINIQNKAFHCQVCEIYVNSETQLKQHMSSRRHKDRLAGKPPKPKYSPYNKLQKNAALAVALVAQHHPGDLLDGER